MTPTNSEDVLKTWLAEEAEVMARLDAGPGPGLARPDQIAGKTGLQVMEGMLLGELPYAEIAKTLDLHPTAVRSRQSRAAKHLRERVGVPPAGVTWAELIGDEP